MRYPQKKQIIYGRVYDTIEDLRVAVDKFVKRYNQEGRIESLGFLSPKQAWENYFTGLAKCA
jgi:hypothetical protein